MKIILMGTPEFVIPIFESVRQNHEIVAVFTRPPKPVGRKLIITKSPVHIWAEQNNLPIYNDIKEIGNITKSADFILVAAYGVILKQNVLDTAPCLNIHYSLLPKYRGANPVAAAIMNGDIETGVCLQQMTIGLDEGDILMSEKLAIGENDTTEELRIKLSDIAKDMVVQFFANPSDFSPMLQIGEPTFAPKSIGDNTDIDWTKPTIQIHNQIRAIGGRTTLHGIDMKILDTKIEGGELIITKVQPSGKKPMSYDDFIRGRRVAGDSN